jgi:hypothetical protein
VKWRGDCGSLFWHFWLVAASHWGDGRTSAGHLRSGRFVRKPLLNVSRFYIPDHPLDVHQLTPADQIKYKRKERRNNEDDSFWNSRIK